MQASNGTATLVFVGSGRAFLRHPVLVLRRVRRCLLDNMASSVKAICSNPGLHNEHDCRTIKLVVHAQRRRRLSVTERRTLNWWRTPNMADHTRSRRQSSLQGGQKYGINSIPCSKIPYRLLPINRFEACQYNLILSPVWKIKQAYEY